MKFNADDDKAKKPTLPARTKRTLLLAAGMAVMLPGAVPMVVAQQAPAADPASGADISSAAQRLQAADQAVSQLPPASTDLSGAAQRLLGADGGISRLPDEVPPYLRHYYHSALTAPGFKGVPAVPETSSQQDSTTSLEQVTPSTNLTPDDAQTNGAARRPVPKANQSCNAANAYDKGNFPATVPQKGANADPAGCVESFQPAGAVGTAGNAFFASLGTNGRTCATCHQPPSGMSVSVANIAARYRATRGTDPIFAGVDGANCPNNLPPHTGKGEAFQAAHSVLLQRGAFRIFLPVPAGAEYTATVVSDPYGCNTDPSFSQDTVQGETAQMLSVYRRPRMSANLGFVAAFATPPGAPANGPAIMWDTREPTLASQARSATLGHAQAQNEPTPQQVAEMVAFETGFFSAQSFDAVARDLAASGAQGGAVALAAAPAGTGGAPSNVAFTEYSTWAGAAGTQAQQQRAAIARGQDLFNARQFIMSNVAGLNDIPLGNAPPSNAVSGTCSTCHNQAHGGNNLFGKVATVDIGVGGGSSAHKGPMPSPDLPVFKLTCKAGFTTPFNGSTVYTNDPGLALVNGKCADIGRFAVPQMRALSSRAPYFSDGSAKSLEEVVSFYNQRFDMKLLPGEVQDLVSFLNAL